MRLGGQRRQRFRAFGQISRLVKNPAFKREDLIGAYAISVRTHRAHRKRLGFGQPEGQIFKRSVASEMVIFEPALIDLRRDGLRFQSRGQE